jgi:hypothetical protein
VQSPGSCLEMGAFSKGFHSLPPSSPWHLLSQKKYGGTIAAHLLWRKQIIRRRKIICCAVRLHRRGINYFAVCFLFTIAKGFLAIRRKGFFLPYTLYNRRIQSLEMKWRPARPWNYIGSRRTASSQKVLHVRYHFGGSMELNARILLLAYMVYL